jgi:hypothetical protein
MTDRGIELHDVRHVQVQPHDADGADWRHLAQNPPRRSRGSEAHSRTSESDGEAARLGLGPPRTMAARYVD